MIQQSCGHGRKKSLALRYQSSPMPRCCLTTPDPGAWTAGKNDTADPDMVARMHSIRDRLSHRMPLSDLIWALNAAVQIDSRTTLGGDIQRCLLSNAADRLEFIYATTPSLHPDPKTLERVRWLVSWRYFNGKVRDAWAVFRRRAVALYVN